MKMKIIQVTDEAIVFSNGNKITYDHVQECCEYNFADFNSLEDTLAMETEFDENLVFEVVKGSDDYNKGSGFRFGNPNNMFFVPFYSEQNGCYTTDIKIYYTNTKEVLNLMCEERIYQHKGDRYKVKKYQEALDWGEENE